MVSPGTFIPHHKAYVFVDGATVRGHFGEIGVRWQDIRLSRLAIDAVSWVGSDWMGGGIRVARVLVYDAMPDEPIDSEVFAWLEQQERDRDTHVRRGYLRADPRDRDRGLRRTQKAVDVQLAVDALSGAADRLFECAVFLTGDGDLAPAVEAISNRGILTAVCGPKRSMSEVLARAADRVGYFRDDPEAYNPADYRFLP